MNDYNIEIDCILSHCPFHGRRVVPPWGNESARIVLVGVSPGAEEEKRSRPFVGGTGKTIKDLARRANLTWDRFFITNAVKCRINRGVDGESEISRAMDCCKGYLDHALLSIKPAVIVTWGERAFRQVMGVSGETVETGSGVWSETYACKVMPLFKSDDELNDPDAASRMEAVFRIAASIAGPGKEKQ